MVAIVVATPSVPSISMTAVIGAVPLLLAAVLFLWIGPETKRRNLTDVSGELLATADAA